MKGGRTRGAVSVGQMSRDRCASHMLPEASRVMRPTSPVLLPASVMLQVPSQPIASPLWSSRVAHQRDALGISTLLDTIPSTVSTISSFPSGLTSNKVQDAVKRVIFADLLKGFLGVVNCHVSTQLLQAHMLPWSATANPTPLHPARLVCPAAGTHGGCLGWLVNWSRLSVCLLPCAAQRIF